MLSRSKAQSKLEKVSAGEGLEAWRQFTLDWHPKVKTRKVAMLLRLFTAHFTGDLSQSLDQFEAMVKEYENMSKKTIDEDIKIGLVIMNMMDKSVQEHLIKNSHRLETWPAMREELLEMTRTTQYLNNQAKPMELGAFVKGQGKGEFCKHCGKKRPQAG